MGYLLVTFGMFYRLDFSALFWEALTVWSQWDLFLLRFSKGIFSLFVKCFYAAHGYCTLCFLEKKMHSVLLLDLKGIVGALSWWMVFLLDSVSSSSFSMCGRWHNCTCSSYSTMTWNQLMCCFSHSCFFKTGFCVAGGWILDLGDSNVPPSEITGAALI